MSSSDKKLSNIFNVESIPALDKVQRKYIESRAYLALVFDRKTDADTVSDTVAMAHHKTGIRYYDLVSFDPQEKTDQRAYRSTEVSMPVWSGDSYAVAAESGNPVDVYKKEYMQYVSNKWQDLHKPIEVHVGLKGEVKISEGMSSDEIKQAARAGFESVLQELVEGGQRTFDEMQQKLTYDKPTNSTALAHKGIVAAVDQPELVQAFAFVSSSDTLFATEQRVLRTAQALRIPAGADFNAMPLVALPDDKAETVMERSQNTMAMGRTAINAMRLRRG